MSHSDTSIYSSEGKSSLSDLPLGKVHISGESNEFITIGGRKYFRDELMVAFGGTLYPGLTPASAFEFGNPAPLGLASFAMTTFVLSLYNTGVLGIDTPNVVVSLAVFYGGAIQMLTGAWELLIGNTFGATALTSYGAFWLSYASLFLDSFGIASAYTDEVMFDNAVGFFLLGWALFTLMLVCATMKSTVAFFGMFLILFITFILLAAGEFTGIAACSKAGGVTGVICAIFAWYNAFAGVANKTNSYVTAHVIPLTKRTD